METESRKEDDASSDGRSLAAVGCCGKKSGVGGGDMQLKRIQWERFLPLRSLRVLLVEHDDSTRHIVAALLRKCSYHVVTIADGLKAWEVMKEKNYCFDLVLTEFEMPSLSGIGLLDKIVGTEKFKNTPVIIMSSQDSVGIVHKCMLKGAADFLVKPVRKNELRNLWQHVWRRHCSSNYAYASEYNAASNQFSTNVGDWSQSGENSDKGSDAEKSLGSKPDTKLKISEVLAEPVISKHGHSPREAEAHPGLPGNNTNTMASLSTSPSVLDDSGVLRDLTLAIANSATQPIQMALSAENSGHNSYGEDDLVSVRCAEVGNEKSRLYFQRTTHEEPAQSLNGFLRSLANGQYSHTAPNTVDMEENALNSTTKSSQMKPALNSSVIPVLEFSLMTQLNGCVQHRVKGKNVLNHSNTSAFSRYGDTTTYCAGHKSNSSSLCVRHTEYVDQPQSKVSCHSSDNMKYSHFASKSEGVAQFQMFSDRNMEEVCALSSGSHQHNAIAGPSSREDTDFHHAQFSFMPLPIPFGVIPNSSFCMRPVIYQAPAENGSSKIYFNYSRPQDDHFANHPRPIKFPSHNLHHPLPFRGQTNDTESGVQRDLSYNQTEEVCKNGSTDKDMLNGSGNNGGKNTITDVAAATEIGLESGNEYSIQNCCKEGMNYDLTLREAALIKFRLKRKDRCFKKKVRYHSRQKLAVQRPRVKGQFVSQKILEFNTTLEADC